MTKILRLMAIFSLLFFCAPVMQAQENAVETKEQPPAKKIEPPTKAQIVEWINELNSESFVEREKAVSELVKAGLPAIPHVMEAAQGDGLEASARAFDILNKWLNGGDPIAKVGAKGALEKISSGEESNKAVRRAKALLAKNNGPQYQDLSGRPAIARAIPLRVGVAPARVELRAMAKMAVGVRGRSVKMTIADGKKTIRVTEGDGLEVYIVEDNEVGIQIKVMEKDKDGKEKTSKYAAKNVEELKEKHPEGHKVYEKYAGTLNGLKVRMEAAKARARAIPEPVKKPEAKELKAE